MRTLTHLLLFGLLFGGGRAQGDTYQFIIQKQEKKAEQRWSLSQWLDQRDRMRMMDLWLALHSPAPYEFYFSGEYQFGRRDGSVGFNSNSVALSFAAYARIFGLEVGYQFEGSEWNTLFHFRVFGVYAQATNLTLHGGLRGRRDPTSYLNPVAGASLTFYFTKNFGVGGLYRHYFPTLHNDPGVDEGGHRFEGEAFIDFSFVRVYARVFAELLDRSAGATGTFRDREGLSVGTKLFF